MSLLAVSAAQGGRVVDGTRSSRTHVRRVGALRSMSGAALLERSTCNVARSPTGVTDERVLASVGEAALGVR